MTMFVIVAVTVALFVIGVSVPPNHDIKLLR